MKTLYKVKVSPQGQITIPKSIRKQMRTINNALFVYVSLSTPSTLHISEEDAYFDRYRGIARPKPGEPSMVDILKELEREEQAKFDARGW